MANVFNSNMNEVFSAEDMQNSKLKEATNKVIVNREEAKWRQKTQIANRDENNKFFHHYTKMRQNINTI